jgi:hypothetical protein
MIQNIRQMCKNEEEWIYLKGMTYLWYFLTHMLAINILPLQYIGSSQTYYEY